MQLSPRLQRHIPWIAAFIAVAAYYPRFLKGGGVAVFSAAADCMARGETPLHCKTVIFAYPPLSALLAVPLTVAPMWLRGAIWYALLIGTLFVSLKLCEKLARRLFPGDWTARELALFRILTFVLSLKFILAVLENQAYDSIALVFVLLGLLALVDKRPVLAGASLAVAAALKVTPLIFLPYLLFKRRFAAAAVFAVVVAFLTLLPDMLMPAKEWHAATWVREVMLAPYFADPAVGFRFWITDSPMNQSFRAAIARIIADGDRNDTVAFALRIMVSPAFVEAVRIVTALYVLTVGALLLKSWRHDRLIAADGSLLIISALLLSPVSSQSHFVGLVLPYAVLAAALVKDRATRVANGAVLLASFVLLTATSNDVAGRALTGWALWHSLPVWGTLVLIVQLGVLIWATGARERSVPPAGAGYHPRG